MKQERVVIMGAAGRDFHDFNVYFRDNDAFEVVAFTAAQIPNIEGRVYPAVLAGSRYPNGIPILPESELPALIRDRDINQVIFAYSDISHEAVMHRASIALAAGADFRLLGPKATMLKSSIPVIAVGAGRTGSGKSQTTRAIARTLRQLGKRVIVVRHPMPYGNLADQIVQRFATADDLDTYRVTIEEREEFEPLISQGIVVYAGIDYEKILRQAEREAQIILWDGGNNDFPFFHSDLLIVVVDPHRPGHELLYHPGETNLRMADVVIINKIDTANAEDINAVRANVRLANPEATLIEAASPIFSDDADAIRGKRVLVIEDGPTLTHGGMRYGAGIVAARKFGAREIVDPRPYAVGSIAEVLERYPEIGPVLPAMGYSDRQTQELQATINATPAELVLIATPIDLRHVVKIQHPTARVRYELQEIGQPTLADVLRAKFGG